MSFAKLVPAMLMLSIVLTVLGVSLGTRRGDAIYLLSRPDKLVRSLLSMHVVMPLLAIAVAAVFTLRPALEVALVALAVSPVSPLVPGKELKAGGRSSYVMGLLFATALLSVATVPIAMQLVGRAFHATAAVPPAVVARAVLITVLAPLLAGFVVRSVSAGFADRAAHPVSVVASVLMIVSFVPVLVPLWPAMMGLVGNGTLLVITGFVVAGFAAGHLLGGPEPEDRLVLALSTASRHPGVAIAVAGAAAPRQRLAAAAVILYLLVSMVLVAVYVARDKRRRAAGPDPKKRETSVASPRREPGSSDVA